MKAFLSRHLGHWLLLGFLGITAIVYWPGLSGGWLFDDYPNIVDNHGVQPVHADLTSLITAALSSPSSDFKRPLASISFALNYLANGLDPYGWKLTNLLIHLVNGLLVFLVARSLLSTAASTGNRRSRSIPGERDENHTGLTAALIAGGWMLLPINLTGVLYIVQRMESMANAFVLLGILGYVAGRRRMLTPPSDVVAIDVQKRRAGGWGGFWLCTASIIAPTAIGTLAKETAVMLPLYALLLEWTLFRLRSPIGKCDYRLVALFLLVLAIPLAAGLAWLLPSLLKPETWAARDFTLGTRLFSEARVVTDYIVWTLLPTPRALSFYHDNFHISTGLLAPWTTLASVLVLAGLAALAIWLRPRRPLIALGIALFLGCQLLTGTILPLELVYEHRNYFASFGLMLAVIPWLAARIDTSAPVPLALPRHALLACLLLLWSGETAMTALAWSNPLELAETLAARAPDSPRAQYELGRTYIIYSHYDPASPFTRLAYTSLEKAAALPDASILPEQALIFMNARMHLPLKKAWWDSLIGKLRARKPGVQDESSLAALTDCQRNGLCDLPPQKMIEAFVSALGHRTPSPRLLATYADYAWNVLDDRPLALRMIAQSVSRAPHEPAYRITYARMLLASGKPAKVEQQIKALRGLNIGGSLDVSIHRLTGRLTHLPADAPDE